MEKERAVIENLREGTAVLDAGCGIGRLSVEATKQGFKVTATDLSKKQLRRAKELFQTKNISIPLVRASLTHIPFKDCVFDSVMCCDVIEHIPQLGFVFSELRRILNFKGKVCVTTPNGYGLYGILYDGILRNLFLMPYLSETSRLLRKREIETEHVYRFTPNLLRKFVRDHHFKITKFVNTEFIAVLHHFVFRCILRRNRNFISRIESADMENACVLPLRLGSEWFLCLTKS